MNLSGPHLKALNGKPKQLVIILHGYGADGEDLISLGYSWQTVLPDADFISPHAPFPCEEMPFGRQWFDLKDWDIDRFYDQDYIYSIFKRVDTSHSILCEFIKNALQERELTTKDLALVGFSQGSMMALAVGLGYPEECAGILGYAGGFLCRDKSFVQSRPPVCLVHGGVDSVIPPQATFKTQEFLESFGIPVESHIFPNVSHAINEEGLIYGAHFLKKIFNV